MGGILPPVSAPEASSGGEGIDTARSRATFSTSQSLQLRMPTQVKQATGAISTDRMAMSREGMSTSRTDISEPLYKTEEFTFQTSTRTRKKKNQQVRLPPLPVDTLNQRSQACRQVVQKLALLRSNPTQREVLEKRVAGYRGVPSPREVEASEAEAFEERRAGEDADGYDSPPLSHRNRMEANKLEVLAMNENTRAVRAGAFMHEERRKIAEAAARRQKLRLERMDQKTAGQRRHDDLRAQRQAAEEAAEREEGGRRMLAALHMCAVMTPFFKFAKELRIEREELKEQTLAVLILQRHSRPWVAQRRAKREAWASEVIGRSMRRYYLRRQMRRKKQAVTTVVSFLNYLDTSSGIINTILHFKECCSKMQRFLRSKHKEMIAQRKVDMGMWMRWEHVMLDYLHQVDAPKDEGKKGGKGGKKEVKGKGNPGKLKKGEKTVSAHGGYTFADLGGFGSVEPDLMRPLARRLKSVLLQVFRKFRKAAAWHALKQYHSEMVEWEEAWEQRERVKETEAKLMSSMEGTVAVEFETPEERQVRKMKEMPPPKQLRKLLTNAEISKLHDIGESQSPNIPFTITLPTAALCCFSLL